MNEILAVPRAGSVGGDGLVPEVLSEDESVSALEKDCHLVVLVGALARVCGADPVPQILICNGVSSGTELIAALSSAVRTLLPGGDGWIAASSVRKLSIHQALTASFLEAALAIVV